MSNSTRDKTKVAVLYDLWEDTPPEAEPEEPRPPKGKPGTRRRRKREKPDREEVFDALEKLGHEPSYLVLDGRPQSLAAVARADADLIFNLTESYAGDDTKDMNIAAYLDLIDCSYTGAGPHALYLAQDKSLAKKIFAFHDIRTPYFATSYLGKLDHAHDISFPLIVKPTSEDGSIGIDSSSVVGSVKELMEKIHYIHEEFDGPALIEEYIEGREIYAAVIGNTEAETLPLIELDLSRLPQGTPRIAGTDVKWEKETQAYKVTKSAPAENLDEETTHRLSETALAAYQALRLRDYGRIDMRLTEKGEVYVIEANPNPWLASGAEFAMAARKAGRSYTQMIGEIVDLALGRY
ncbi:MAG: ATP-grasp domain-containing protein [Acidobacteria bacterium]|nr:ATP-grasp domain-containing protein [Acidobacteriota bacterium]MCA1609329.1 ATP-grasp domain-containing protein [Acidobacteriota bacterium]